MVYCDLEYIRLHCRVEGKSAWLEPNGVHNWYHGDWRIQRHFISKVFLMATIFFSLC